MKVIIIILILTCSFTSFGKPGPTTPIASNLINCSSDLYDKNGNCELVLSYNSTDLSVTLIKLYHREDTEGANINDFVKHPADFQKDATPVNYQEKLNLKENESIISVGGGFKRSSKNNNLLEIKLRVQVGVKKVIIPTEIEEPSNEQNREVASEEVEIITYENKRQVYVNLDI